MARVPGVGLVPGLLPLLLALLVQHAAAGDLAVPTFAVETEEGWFEDSLTSAFRKAWEKHPRKVSSKSEADFVVRPAWTADMVEKVLHEPAREGGKFFLVDTRGLDLESCCRCGDETLAHKVNHANHADFAVGKKDDFNAKACRHFRALAARSDVVIMSPDLFGGALCCRGRCADRCGMPQFVHHVTYDDFAAGLGSDLPAGDAAADDVNSRRFLASFRGGCKRGLWNSSRVRLDAKVAVNALGDRDVVYDCGGFEQGHVWKCCSNYDQDAHGSAGAGGKAPRRCAVTPCAGGLGYSALLRASKFGLAPRGAMRWSSRLSEVMAHDAVPVVVSDGYELPFSQVVDWSAMSVTASEEQLSTTDGLRELVATLRKADATRMLTAVRRAYRQWFASTERRIDALLLSAAVAGGKLKRGLYAEYAAATAGSGTQAAAPPPAPAVDGKGSHVAGDVMERARAAKKEFSALKASLEKYWNGRDILSDSWLYDADHKEGRAYWASKLASAIAHGRPLTMGVIGSSVAAGHDNCAYDSFENQLQRTMHHAFSASGVDFTVRNAGQGGGCGDSMHNQVWCLPSMVGTDVDFTLYTWTYFEAGSVREALSNIHELFIRWSLLMPRGPSPTILYAGDGISWPEDYDSLFEQYAKFGFNVVSITHGLLKHGMTKAPGWGEVGDGLHTTTRYGEAESDARKKSLGVFYRNWHPGPLGFQVVADAIAWRLAAAGVEAADMLLSGASVPKHGAAVPPSSLGEAHCSPTQHHDGPNPPPLYLAEYCTADALPSCVNHELPTFGTPEVEHAESSDTANPMRSRTNATFDVKQEDDSRLIPDAEKALPQCKHANYCRGVRSTFMTYKLPKLTVGYVKVCCTQFDNDGCGADLLRATYRWNERTVTPLYRDNPKKCVIVSDKFGGTNSVSAAATAPSYLSIEFPSDMADFPYISHVIAQ